MEGIFAECTHADPRQRTLRKYIMEHIAHYASPLGGITLAGTGEALTGLWFDGQKYFGASLSEVRTEEALPVLEQTKRWLDCYFSGTEPDFMRRWPRRAPPFSRRYGRSCGKSPMAIRSPTRRSPNGSPPGGDFLPCPPRRWAAQWGGTPFPSSFPVTGCWEAPAA